MAIHGNQPFRQPVPTSESRGHTARRALDQSVPRPAEDIPSTRAAMDGDAGDPLAELLYRIGQGDEDAFALFYRETAGRVHALTRRVMHDPDLSSDTTQEVYLQVWRTAAQYDPSAGSSMAWLMMITHRRAVDRVRSEQSFTTRTAGYGISTMVTNYGHTVEPAMHGTTIQQESIQLAYNDGLTFREVAETLGVPLATAKTRLRDGLLQLRPAQE